jgi:NitT/TauT family transport system permease protein
MKTSTSSADSRKVPFWAVIFWLLVWQFAAMLMDQPLLLVSPWDTLKRLSSLVLEPIFWKSIAFSVGKIMLGFGLSCVLGIVLAALAYRFRPVRQLLSPLTATIKAIPVASFVILALLWVSSKNLSILISVMIGFPVIYLNTLTGLDSIDHKLVEMAQVFRVPLRKKIGVVYFSQVLPFLRSGLNVAVGLCWKSGVAAEVIGIPSGSVGQQLYNAKVYLETADLFCWTVVIVLLSVACEKLLMLLFNQAERWALR